MDNLSDILAGEWSGAERRSLAVPCSTAAVIAELRLREVEVSPEVRVAAARAARAAMTPPQRSAVAARNAELYAASAHKVKMTNIDMGARPATETRSQPHASSGAKPVPDACPRCGMQARGHSDGERVDWYGGHYRSAHPEMGY
jgi:hypothetical protein